MNKNPSFVKMSLGGAAVALVILIDLATGQGPAGLNNYVGIVQPLPEFRHPVPVRPSSPQYMGVVPDYVDAKKVEKEFEKESVKESKQVEKGFGGKFIERNNQKTIENGFGKEQNKAYVQEFQKKNYGLMEPNKAVPYYPGPGYGPAPVYGADHEKEKKVQKSTRAPGMLASLSETMSKAWNSWG